MFSLFMCSVLGGILIVAGLYSVLWGKYKEHKELKEKEAMALPFALKGSKGNVQAMGISVELDEVDVEKAKADGGLLAVTIPAPEAAKA